jgi:hypothetical protein
MNETSAVPALSEAAGEVIGKLEALSDEDLQEVVNRGQGILAARVKARQAEAVRELRRIAKTLGVKVEESGRKRGRPKKPKQEPSP